jgi:hypothetical protein
VAVLDTEFLNDLQWLLVEPQDGGVTWPSGLWTVAEVLASINRVQSEFLRRTEITAAWEITPNQVAGDPIITVPQDYILALELIFQGPTTAKPLTRSDEWELDRAIPTWETTTAEPIVYGDGIADDILDLVIAPTPNVDSRLYLLYVACGAPISNDGLTEFTVPDEAVVTILWGVLADLLDKVGRGEDLERARYCHQRFEEGVLIWILSLQGVLG